MIPSTLFALTLCVVKHLHKHAYSDNTCHLHTHSCTHTQIHHNHPTSPHQSPQHLSPTHIHTRIHIHAFTPRRANNFLSYLIFL